MPQSSPLRIGTRGSRLALTQANIVRDLLAKMGVASAIVVVKTTGDRIQDRPLADAGGKGLFTKELEEALFAQDTDIAVHSMKDVPAQLPTGLMLGALLEREDPRDVLLSSKTYSLASLPPGAIVGTSSVRRRAQLLRVRKDVEAITLRGNVDTRLAKLDSGAFDATLLALAGLKRLGLDGRARHVLDPAVWLPSPAQGAIGIELRSDDAHTRQIIAQLEHEPTAIALACERAFLAALDGSCRTPIAGLARWENGVLKFRGEVLALDGSDFVETALEQALGSNPREDAAQLGRAAGLALRPTAARWLDL
ncbi:MAG TPA: hydroxymethylbilane synthase [Rhizomicrobium sp.]|nr:hydroxymethylbilane synthase [Rhizomicrobium sp.]